MNKVTLSEKIRYHFDNLMAKGMWPMIAGLALVCVVAIALFTTVLVLLGIQPDPAANPPKDFGALAWDSLMRIFDSGTFAGDPLPYGFYTLVITLVGIFIFSTLISILSSGLEARLEKLRQGRSRVIESGHVVILGWSDQVFTILPELIEANRNRRRGSVVAILADLDKVEMDEAIRTRVPHTFNTKIICRSGSPFDPAELQIVNPHYARSVIILPDPAQGSNADASVVKTALALSHAPDRRPEPYHIVAQISDPRLSRALELITVKDDLQVIHPDEIIARMTVQTSRQSGLSVVYTELLNFGGDEIYFQSEPALAGRTYRQAVLAYENSAVLGIYRENGKVELNPSMDSLIGAADKIIAISQDDDTIVPHQHSEVPLQAAAIQVGGSHAPVRPEKTLLLGWSAEGRTILEELDRYVAPGSTILVVAGEEFQREAETGLQLRNQTLTFQIGDTTDRDLLDSLGAPAFDHVMVLADRSLEVQEADSRTLMTLVHLRDIADHDATPFSVVSQMLDLRNRQLAEATRIDDFIVSDHLISLMVAQLTENSHLGAVFRDLLDPDGSDISLQPVTEYIAAGSTVNFYTLAEAAARRGETALGYRLASKAHDPEAAYGVVTNPNKGQLVTFSDQDRLIVLARRE